MVPEASLRRKKVYKKFLSDYIVSVDESIYKAHWKLHRNRSILIVCDLDEKFLGVITFRDIEKTYNDMRLTIKDICNRDCKYIYDDGDDYGVARNIFAEYPYVKQIPVLDKERNIVDLMTRNRAFWRERYMSMQLPRMHYAYCIYAAALEAKALGYPSFSVIEFGVAGGSGLVNCEFHAKEISKILDIEIEVYGFDSSEGLPEKNMGYKDMVHIWPGGSYHMDRKLLEDRIQFAQLVIGDIEKTTEDFFERYSPAPIGSILVDVDYYSSAIHVLRFLEKPDAYFLPRVQMYFDDIIPEYECQGENLAIKEFNLRNENIKISPEKMYYSGYRERTKICHRFLHEKYNDSAGVLFDQKLFSKDYELPLSEFI